MSDEWFVRVQGKEYGPVSTDTLREWKGEGRLIRENELRRADEERWIAAGQFPEIFDEVEPPPAPPEPTSRARTWQEIFGATFWIYRRGFARFMVFGLLSALPLFVLQWTLPKLPFPDFFSETPAAIPAQTLPPISVFMLLLFLATLPISIAGMQFVADDLLRGTTRSFAAQFSAALARWSGMLGAGLLVYGSYFFWIFAPFAAMLAVIGGGISALSLLLYLLIGAFMVYMIGRLFVNFLFWEQVIALSPHRGLMALRESKELARSVRHGPRLDRPLYRGVIIASVWLLLLIVLMLSVQLPFTLMRFAGVSNPDEAMALMQTLSQAKTPDTLMIVTDVASAIVNLLLRPLLAASFVVLYYDARARAGRTGDQ
jgi:hypothetical protein